MESEGESGYKRKSRAEPSERYVAIGRAGTPRGLRGEFRVDVLTDFPERFEVGRSLYVEGERYLIEKCYSLGGKLYIKLSSVDDPASVSSVKGKLLEIPEAELKPLAEGEYYQYQLIGLRVQATTGLPLGRIQEILSTGSNDVYVVYGMMGEILLPATSEVIKKIDLEAGFMEIELVPGLLPDRRKR